ncbi:hypothetical protein ACB092_10G107600 [Castanea dentata]
MDVVTGLVAEKPVVIFSKSSCCMSHSINSLICSFGANPTSTVAVGCQPTVPAVFIGQEFIGGANEVMSLQVRNELVPLLIRSKAIWIWNKSK